MIARRAVRAGIARITVGVLAVGGLVVAGASPALAAPSVTVAPSKNLADRQEVEVDGDGFSPNITVGVLMCVVGAVGPDDCDLGTIDYDTTGNGGGFHIGSFVVHRIIETPNQGEVDCAPAACVIGAGNISDYDESAGHAVTFDPDIPPIPELKTFLRVDDKATVKAKSGNVTLHGEFRCNRKGPDVWFDASLEQRAGRVLVFGYGYSWDPLVCKKTYQPWSMTVESYNGIFKAGKADAFVYMYAEDTGEYDSDFVEKEITLVGS